MNRSQRIGALREALASRVLVLDGAMGTALQDRELTADDFGGPDLEGCNENLVLTRPDVIRDVHRRYLEAGADIVETNTFGGTPLVLAEYGLQGITERINLTAARLARAEADAFCTPSRLRWVAGSIGPTTKALSVTGGVTFRELVEHFYAQALALHRGGVDYLLVETCQDTRNIKAALLGIERVFNETGEPIPVAVSGTIEAMGTMLAGQSVEALATSLEHADLLYLGLNCATGPEFMTDHIRTLASLTRAPVACVPNAGLPDEDGRYLESPAMVARVLRLFGEEGWLNLVGGCCGTGTDHIAALAELAQDLRPRVPPVERGSTLSGIDYLEVTDELRPVLVGERTNVIGSRKFKRLIAEERFEEAAEIARAQVKRAASVIDICLANPDRDELEDMRRFLDVAVRMIKVPLMIDSTDAQVVELALEYSQGKAIINSINLEDGEERLEQIVPLARRYGAALVVGCIDEDPIQGMAVSRQRKLEVAQRTHHLLTRKYGVPEEDLYFDALVFPCATGDAQYVGSAVETIEGVRLIKRSLPRCKTVLGISNVSFGLPAAGREVLNAVFLYHCVQAGLDLALVNSEKLERYASIAPEDRRLAEDLLWNRGEDPVAAFAAHFRERKEASGTLRADLPLDERLARYIIEGTKDGLVEDLAEKLKEEKPLNIINGPLMTGMDEVGRLFNNNELIVAEVLQSAEAMKAAVAFLEPYLDKVDSASRGKVLLATVKGDVHDIGKNLVDIILSNNGFEVVNLGIKVPPERLLEAIREHKPDLVGLSGLLVKSAQQMVITAGDLTHAGVTVPMLVGGAALSRSFVNRKIAPAYGGTVAYASDAMNGLDLAKKIVSPEQLRELEEQLAHERETAAAPAATRQPGRPARRGAPTVRVLDSVPAAPDLERHVLPRANLDQIWRFINPTMLYGRHLGLRGPWVRELDSVSETQLSQTPEGRKALEIREAVEAVRAECRKGSMHPRAIYQFFRAQGDGDDLVLLDPSGSQQLTRFRFPRQRGGAGLCLADYAAPSGGALPDTVALFVTTAGEGISALAQRAKEAGEYLRCHILQALALETAEGYAELLHATIRSMWGFPDAPQMTMRERFQGRYRGKRYSFGYPACPRLEDQAPLFELLRPEEIGIRLTDGFMMEPEASVSAVVFHHPDASYFSVGEESDANADAA